MESIYLLQIAIVLLFAKTLSLVSRKIKLPQVIGALLAGVILGPICLNLIDDTQTLDVLAKIGIILIMFNAGMETDFQQLKKSLKASVFIALLGIIVPLVSGYLLAHFVFEEPTMDSIFLGIILTATSLSITIEALNEMGKLKTKVGAAIMGAAIFDDILGIVILSLMISVKKSSGELVTVLSGTLLKIAAFFILTIAAGFLINKLFFWIFKKSNKKRRIPIYSLAFCLIFAFAAELFGIADITGAYIAGLVFCNLKSVEYIEEKINILSYMFFTPIFIASIGLKTNLHGFNIALIVFAVLYLIIAVLSKIIGCGLGALICKFSKRESLQIGVGMVSRGEVALVITSLGITNNMLNPIYISPVILVIVLTTLITPLLLKLVFKTDNR